MPAKQVKDASIDEVIAKAGAMSVVNFVKRPAFGTKGRHIEVYANSYQVTAFPTTNVIQYDVQMGDGTLRRTLVKKLWNSVQFKNAVGGDQHWRLFLFDGNKLAWSYRPLRFGKELNIEVDLAKEPGVPPGREADVTRIFIRQTATVVLEPVNQWISGKSESTAEVQQGITFLNHLISQSLRLDPANVCLKRSFFRADAPSILIEGGLVVKKGLFLSVRGGQNMLTVNVDVATSVFWPSGTLLALMGAFLGQQGGPMQFASWLQSKMNDKKFRSQLQKFKKILFFTKHKQPLKADRDQKRLKIDGFTEGTAITTTFVRQVNQPDGSVKDVKISVNNYFRDHWKRHLQFPHLPLVKTKRAGEIPIECCFVDSVDNRYLFKLEEKQTASMIKFTATRPDDRRRAIATGIEKFRWNDDVILSQYKMKVNQQMMKVKARILPSPELAFNPTGATRNVLPSQTAQGQWDLRGKKFSNVGSNNDKENLRLKVYGCLIFTRQNLCSMETAKKFMRLLMGAYVGHGGVVEDNNPIIEYAQPPNVGKNIHEFWLKVGNRYKRRPQILFFIVPYKNSLPYNEIKQYCENELGVVSQCNLLQHVERCQQQYLSNVCLKVNAKLGGSTCYLANKYNPLHNRGFNMMIGADVSHPAPGLTKPSFAAMVGSMDAQATRYGAICNTNGTRKEMITPENMSKFLKTMIKNFQKHTNNLPSRIFYFRDGVSEQQYHDVLKEELPQMRLVCEELHPGWKPKFTITICSKRHHHRFFPVNRQDGDRSGNCLPGTIVERDICDPQEYDFYLISQKAIQGTARSTHYYVILDETGIPVDDFQAIINNMCYTYCRATTAVSLIPPVYYAHLASQRARCHEKLLSEPSKTQKTEQKSSEQDGEQSYVRPLNVYIQDAMWFV